MTCDPVPGSPDVFLSVWATAQRDARTQRQDRYLPGSMAHPGKMLPAIAATAITRYSAPGDLVGDPMCGIGTTLVEAVHLGRDALGIEYEGRWAGLAAANIAHARRRGASGSAEVIRGDARHLASLLPPGAEGQAALIVTSPPYGPSVHGQVSAEARSGDSGGVRKYDNTYGTDPANLARRRLDDLLTGITQILAACRILLRPGGTVVLTTRPWRHRGELTDFPSMVLAAGAAAGLIPAGRDVALLAGLRDGQVIARPSFFQMENVRKARRKGEPWHLIVHEDVLIFTNPANPGSSRDTWGSRRNPGDPAGPDSRASHWEDPDQGAA